MEKGKADGRIWLVACTTLTLCGLLAWYAINQRSTFTKEKWRDCGANPGSYNRCPGRENTLNDLLENYPLQQMNYAEVSDLLGPPDITDTNRHTNELVVKYEIVTECLSDIDPDHSKYLVLVFPVPEGKLNTNERIRRYYVDEWRSGE
jgi:hypothetical protein